MFDAPDPTVQSASGPTLLLAASTPTAGWTGRAIRVDVGGQSLDFRAPARKSVLGQALAGLSPGDPFLIDGVNQVEVELVDPDQWLTSCDDEALANGANLAFLGRELIQFGVAVPTGAGRFRLGRLVRGRYGTEWAIGGHQAGEAFALAASGQLASLSLPQSAIGAIATATPANGAGAAVSMIVGAEALRPPQPVAIAASLDEGGALRLGWTRRSRHGWIWRDEVEVPLGEAVESYAVSVSGSAGVAEARCSAPAIVMTAADLSVVGPGAALVEVRQIGEFAASRAASATIILP